MRPFRRGLLRRVRQRLDPHPAQPSGRMPPAPDSGFAGVLAKHVDVVPERRRRRVVILADDRVDDLVPALLRGWDRADSVLVIGPESLPSWDLAGRGASFEAARTLVEVNWVLRFLGPVDVLVDAGLEPAQVHDEHWKKLFFHLRAGGVWLLPRAAISDGEVPASLAETARYAGIASSLQTDRFAMPRELALATADLRVDRTALVTVKQGNHLLKLRDKDANRILPKREPRLGLEIVATRPGGHLVSRATVTSHGSFRPQHLDLECDYPNLYLRQYRGRIAMVASALLYTGATALPDSFRHHRSSALRNPGVIDANGDFGRVRERLRPHKKLEGTFYHLDSENSGHFGHLMTEVISRLWGWDQAKAKVPDLKAAFRIRYPNERRPELELAVFEAYGIARDDIVWFDEPVWVESVVAATPMWHNAVPHHIHPDIVQTWQRLKTALAVGQTGAGERVFVSRRSTTGNRVCRNTPEVEAFFAGLGFTIVYPEDHSLGRQAVIFDEATIIAGFGGSAMFNLLYASGGPTVILLNHEAYTARNEHLYTMLTGGDVHYFWSPPYVAHPEGGWSEAAYYSDWEFDLEGNRADLLAVIENAAVLS